MSRVILFTHPIKEHITVNRNYKWCNNLRQFRKTIKPYGDKESVVMPWNDGDHARKFIECKCDVLDEKNNASQIDKQRFWGEWEQPSRVYTITKDDNDPEMANYLHIPLVGKLDDLEENKQYKNYQNTDPYVFGDSFYYCCCKQSAKGSRKNLINLDENDIIIFCGLLGDKEKGYKYAVDTIFVIEKPICKYGTRDTNEESKNIIKKLDKKYINGVLNPVLYGNDESLGRADNKYFVLYKAKMYKAGSDDIFSYFPIKKELNYKKVEIPYEKMREILDDEKTGGKILNRSQAGLHVLDSRKVWNDLKEYIVNNQGYSLGIKAYDEFDEIIIKS